MKITGYVVNKLKAIAVLIIILIISYYYYLFFDHLHGNMIQLKTDIMHAEEMEQERLNVIDCLVDNEKACYTIRYFRLEM